MENSLLSPKQAGFRKNYGIYDPLIDLTSFIHHSFNNSSVTLCIYVDLAKAFNSLDTSILFYKLEKLGFKGNMLELLRSYIVGRRQVTLFDNTESSSGIISHGVAQGSVLEPLLFSIYMNNLPNVFKIMNTRMYADDTVLFCEIKKGQWKEKIKEVNKELESFSEWCKANFLTINVQKTR